MSAPAGTTIRSFPDEPWALLFARALKLIDSFNSIGGVRSPLWTLGGGTVLMLRYQHRRSKDIDIFVPDPQYLGYVTPRLSNLAADISHDYVEASGFVKLVCLEGEIDFVASPNLTAAPFELWEIDHRMVRVETAAEIIAKKLWHRGDTATARDLFDLSLVIERDPEGLRAAASFLLRHREKFLAQIRERKAILSVQFDAIDVLDYRPSFDDAAERARLFLTSLT